MTGEQVVQFSEELAHFLQSSLWTDFMQPHLRNLRDGAIKALLLEPDQRGPNPWSDARLKERVVAIEYMLGIWNSLLAEQAANRAAAERQGTPV